MGFVIFLIALIWFFVMYKLYGGYIAKKVFKLDDKRVTPAHELKDGVDYVPTNKWVVWGHHYTSIAGLGPIVGPAIGIIWGWVPALLWVTLGTIFAGAVHDFSALVISMRNKGKSLGEVTAKIIGPRARYLFFIVIFLELWIVIAVFALIMGILFNMYPSSVFPVWMEIPIALLLSHMVFKRKKSLDLWSWLALVAMYATIAIGVFIPIKLPGNAVVSWLVIMLIYSYIASVLPVETLLQPRDYINAHELLVAIGLIFLGAVAALIRSPQHLAFVAPSFNLHPKGAPSFWPFIFVTISCGAISGFHSLVSSGTSSKQVDKESDAKLIGYGGMVSEGILAALVILAVSAGIGTTAATKAGGLALWNQHYSSWAAASGLGAKIGGFITGSTNMLTYLFGDSGYIKGLITTIMGVFIVSFAGTSLDTAARSQRYVIQELGKDLHMKWMTKKHPATLIAILSAFALAMAAPNGKGALILWPLFGTVNQLLAGLALLVATVYLLKKHSSYLIAGIPMVFMVIMTGWAMVMNIKHFNATHNVLLLTIAIIVFITMLWLIVEAFAAIMKTHSQHKKGLQEVEEFE
ncbi:carbon starvation CstA family protein [Mesoaciditoga lauensis]|uniref:carbon starvation CstA family protein n=1 Tax=Mesoaciditoga lauensis TaxID=1495039 RepID=UPI00056C2C2B|nr:carbon starvation protein A [Mesoaciditoga lauensis]